MLESRKLLTAGSVKASSSMCARSSGPVRLPSLKALKASIIGSGASVSRAVYAASFCNPRRPYVRLHERRNDLIAFRPAGRLRVMRAGEPIDQGVPCFVVQIVVHFQNPLFVFRQAGI